jgi:hypothetical protein
MNFGELKTALGDWLEKDEDSLPDAIRGQIINMAMRQYLRSRDLDFGEYTADVVTTPSVQYSSFPTGFSRPFSIYYIDSNGNRVDVDFLTKEEFEIKYPTSVDGDVVHYTLWAGKLWWGLTPATAITMKFNHFRLLPDLSDPADHNDFTDTAWELLLFRSLSLCSLFGIEDTRMALWESEATRQEGQLSIEHSRRRTVGRRPTTHDYGFTGR